jgi:hypothetical protein
MLLPNELRSRAEFYRALSLQGDDVRLKVALLSLAKEFEREAEDAEAAMADVNRNSDTRSRGNSATRRPEATTGPDIDPAR